MTSLCRVVKAMGKVQMRWGQGHQPILTPPRQGETMNELILLLGQTALVLAGVCCCVGFVVVIVSGLTWSVRKLKELQRL